MHKRSYKLNIVNTGDRIYIGDREIDISNVKPVDLLLAALAYGVGIRYIDKTGEEFRMECEVENYRIKCRAKCSGEEERCLVFRTLKETIEFQCIE
ncbi:MAG: hypothetical protein QXY12_05320 [Pyrobaculum sp.]